MKLIFDFIKDTFLSEFQTTMAADRIASSLLVSFFVALYILIIYRITYQGIAFSRSFALSLPLLAMVTSVIIMTVTTNLALSLGMVGALSIVRFRTAVKDPADTVFMFWAISAGIMAGAGLVYISIITNFFLGALYLVYFVLSKKLRTAAPYLLVIRYENQKGEDVQMALSNLKNKKIRSKTVSDGTTELCLEIKMTPESLNLIDSLSATQGVISAAAVSYGNQTTL